MMRRKVTRPGAEANAPANPTSASGAPPAGSVPAGGDEPPSAVIHELLAAFSAGGPAPPAPPARAAAPPPPPAPSAREPGAPTRSMAPNGTAAPVGLPPPADPAPAASGTAGDRASQTQLVAEPTRRSARRSRKEAKREAKREKRRLAEHAKAQKKASKQTVKARRTAERSAGRTTGRRAGRKARRQGQVDGSPFARATADSDVRIISTDDPSVPPVLPTAPSPPTPQPAPRPALQPASPTIRIAGDDLPDAVYIEGDLGDGGGAAGSGERSTVFIDEDPSRADVVTMDVATSAARMEPRIRERRIAVRRAVGRRRMKWITLVAAMVLVGVAAFAVLGSSMFTISTVRVDGRVYSGGAAFDAVVADLEGANVLRVDTASAERELERIPWVADARVTTDFPNGATIEVREREPSIAYQGTDGRYRVLDRDGRVLDVIAGQPVAYLELFVPDAADLEPGQPSPRGYRAAARLVQALTPQMRARVVSVSCDAEATDLRMILDAPLGGGGVEVRFGAAEDLVDKLVRLQTALTDPDPEGVPTEMIDVSGPDLISR